MISDRVLARLKTAAELPDLSGTRYHLIEEIGRGGMGIVYLAEDPELGRRVAIKIVEDAREARGSQAWSIPPSFRSTKPAVCLTDVRTTQ